MIKISTKSQYGLRAMIFLARQKKICPLKTISQKEGMPFDYLEKIAGYLEKAGLIEAKKGIGGGYFLSRSASKIKAGEIIRTLEGKKGLVSCAGKEGKKCPLQKRCLAKNFWFKIQKALDSALDSLTLAQLIK